jgi:DNA-binding beta-propeller fold protein YncE
MPFPGITRLSSPGRPVEVAISPDETFCLISNSDRHNVSRFDLATGEKVAVYEGGVRNPAQIAISASGTCCLICSPTAARVTMLNLRTGAMMQQFDGLDSVAGVVLCPGEKFALAHCVEPMARIRNIPNAIARLDLSLRKVSWPFPAVHTSGRSLAVSKCGSFLLCTDTANSKVCKVSLQNGTVVEEYVVRLAHGISIAPTLDYALVGCTGTSILRIDLDRARVDADAFARDAEDKPFEGAYGVAIATSGRFALVANSFGDSVSLIDIRPPEERGAPASAPGK